MPLPLHRHGLVGDRDTRVVRCLQRARQLQAPEQLRRQRAPQALAWLGGVDAAVVAGQLERVAHRCGQDRTNRIGTTAFEQLLQVGLRQVGAGRVVDQDEIVGTHAGGKRGKPRQH